MLKQRKWYRQKVDLVRRMSWHSKIGNSPLSHADHQVWTLMEAFANMDLARITELSIDEALEAFKADPWKNPAESPGDIAFRMS